MLVLALALVLGTVGAPAGRASAEPMDLSRADARWIAVRFERSPADLPGQTDTVYSRPLAAWLEPDPASREIRIVIDGASVEEHLLEGHDPVPGSFGAFTWSFDADTGEVRSARLEGRLWRHIVWGRLLEVPIQVNMDTQRRAGFAAPRILLGHEYRSFCFGDDERCTVVEPRIYDPATGYVNAVGEIHARTGPFRVRSFSPLGEAIFSELPGGPSAIAHQGSGTPGR